MDKKYRSFFSIDESYFPAVNLDVIKTQPEVWKSYYPHESFIKLLKQAKSVLTNNQRMSIWVEGAYGTGKSHAVLTLKKMIDCSNAELKEYFDKYSRVLSSDLYNDFYSIKNQQKKILTVHRYGSSEVRNDKVLMECVQESIINALKENGISYLGQVGIKQAIINWLSDDVNRKYFDNLICTQEYRIKFEGKNADDILQELKTRKSEDGIQKIIEKISDVGEDKGIRPFVLQKEDLRTWILDVINKNDLKAIFFIWDEFSDYFDLNKGNLSGFQFLAEMSETQPFYLCIVTHKSDIFFENTKDDVKTKINGRFISPHCSIELPDNMAFVLTAHAMKKTDDPQIQEEWDDIVDALYNLTHDSREEVIKTAKIGEKELKGVLPIHPYAALVLKHIASAFDSNQRSMFDFIKNDRGDDIKGFQWFIDNYGPYDDDKALLTVDFLWDYFYEKGKDNLAPQIRQILDVYERTGSHKLDNNQKRVLKTILLLQAINEKVGDAVSLFIPNKKNIAMAFEGTDIKTLNAESIAQSLVREQIIFERPMGGGAMKYSALISSGNQEEIEKEKERIKREVRTDKLIEEGDFFDDFKLPAYLAIRYPVVKLLTCENIKMTINQLKSDSNNHPNHLYVAYAFARNQEESNKIRSEIKKTYDDGFEKIVFVDYSQSYLSDDLFNQYVENMANCNYQKSKDAGQSKTYDKNAKEALKRWKNLVKASDPRVFKFDDRTGTIYNSESQVFDLLKEFDREHFEYAIETYVNVIDNMYMSNALKQGAECGITCLLRGTFRSANDNTKLEKQFAGVWNVDKYWINKPNELLSKVKNAVEDVIKRKLDSDSRVSIADIYDVLKEKPFGFMSCNLSAFVLGFVLKEYANDTYNWTDDLTTVPMSIDKLKEMIDEIVKLQQTPNPKYRDKYIVAMSKEQREFNEKTSIVFNIPKDYCTSIENTRTRVRLQMAEFKFPIWTLKYCVFNTANSTEDVHKLIDLYVELANNSSSKRSDTDIALEIGKLYLNKEGLCDDLKNILTEDNCLCGMKNYLEKYKGGILITCAKNIGDSGSFINEIKNKFSEASNWVWNKDTVDDIIDEVIIEYKIVVESNKLIVKTSSYEDCLKEWAKKVDSFKIPYVAIRSDVGHLSDFLDYLRHIKLNGDLYKARKQNFLSCLINQSKEFRDFCENQLSLLKKIYSFNLDGLDDNDISKIASNELNGVFTLENSDYQSKLDNAIKAYKASMAKYRLLELWKDKTHTESPMDWSNRYLMPILCMIPANEQDTARDMFDVINGKSTAEHEIDDAINWINEFKYFDDLNDVAKRDYAFKKHILKSYSTLIDDDINDIKQNIKNKNSTLPYYWLGSEEIDNYVKNVAFQKYNNGGSSKADAVIDSMSPDDLKKYLKELIKDNMVVGIEIINNKK